ncbi:MAG: TRAP transporter substrate-binding protein [Acidimicrobiales bacterium]|nr:TRAP transporter substrate-binding protein [Hyphomonadaceae bacterium]RZV38313.1 MAG: TRAP transporter substrate-binding protein [Acidimicrobiales bacterium]
MTPFNEPDLGYKPPSELSQNKVRTTSTITRRDFTRSVGACAGLGLTGCAGPSNSGIRLKLAHTLNNDHPVHKAMVFMGQKLSELSSGTMSLEIYSNGQLGSERQLIELLQIGSLAMTKVSTISMEGFSPVMKLFSIPYLFKDTEHFWRVLNSDIGQSLLDSLRGVRLQGLGYYSAGSRSFYMTEAPILTPADLVSKKVRVLPSRTSIEMVEALGGAATPISWGELYTALQQGIVDGAENNPPSYYLSKHYETAKYYTLDEHTSVPDLIIMSRRVFDGLSEQQRAWLEEAMSASVIHQRKLWDAAEKEALSEVAKAGVEIIYPDKQPFRDAVAPMKTALAETELGPLIRKVEALEEPS